MDWIFNNLQIVVIVGLALASIIKARFEANRNQRETAAPVGERTPGDPPDTSYRKRMPPSPPPDPPVTWGQLSPAIPARVDEISVEVRAAREEAAKALKHQVDLAEHLRILKETKATTTGGAAATRARVAAKGVAQPLKRTPLSIRKRLSDPAEVRRAFVMREILDPPVGLR